MNTVDSVLELSGLSKTYRPGLFRKPVRALCGLDLRVERGETHGLVGPNGAGKTTAFKILLGLLRASGGEGRLLGRPLGDRAARDRIGFLPELPAYYPHLRVGELLRFARALSGVRADEREDGRLLAALGLDGLAGRPLRRLSKGQLQRIGLAQALVHGPELLILDEPMSGLDPIGRSLVKDILRRERARGRTIILSSHVLADVESLADRVTVIDSGRRVAHGEPRALLAGTAAAIVIEGSGPLPGDVLSGMPSGSERSGNEDAWVLRLARPEPAQLDACLRRILAAGGRVIRVETTREDLERFFLRRLAPERTAAETEGRCANRS